MKRILTELAVIAFVLFTAGLIFPWSIGRYPTNANTAAIDRFNVWVDGLLGWSICGLMLHALSGFDSEKEVMAYIFAAVLWLVAYGFGRSCDPNSSDITY